MALLDDIAGLNRDLLREIFAKPTAKVEPALRNALRRHFQKRPFDLLRYGLLKIESDGEIVWFEPNDEQMIQLEFIEQEWYAGRPVFIICLKARQIGESTFGDGLHFCLLMTRSLTRGHLVTDVKPKAQYHVGVIKRMYKHFPRWLGPHESKKVNPVSFDDPLDNPKIDMSWLDEDLQISECEIHVESAEQGENVSRGLRFYFNHFSELGFWNPNCAEDVKQALEGAIFPKYPFFCLKESTGRSKNDSFAVDYFRAKDGQLGIYKAFFFPWYAHKGYSLPLPDGMTAEEFKESARVSEYDLQLLETCRWPFDGPDSKPITVEQLNWYVSQREYTVGNKGHTLDMFRREFPSNEHEAFLGTGSNYFNADRVLTDRNRINSYIPMKLGNLQRSISEKVNKDVEESLRRRGFARCELDTDWQNSYSGPKFRDDRMGAWRVWEKPRFGHEYYVTVDSSEGKELIKGVRTTRDFGVIDVWRTTYEPWEHARLVQVAQFRSAGTDPVQLAREAYGASVIYGDKRAGSNAFKIIERNSSGTAVIYEVQRAPNPNLYHRTIYGKAQEEISSDVGFQTTGGETAEGSKKLLISQINSVWSEGFIQINSSATNDEMSAYGQDDKGKFKGIGAGVHDDTISSLMLFVAGLLQQKGVGTPVMVIDIIPSAAAEEEDEAPAPEVRKREFRRFRDLEYDSDGDGDGWSDHGHHDDVVVVGAGESLRKGPDGVAWSGAVDEAGYDNIAARDEADYDVGAA